MEVADYVTWVDRSGQRRYGFLAYIAEPGERLPDWLFKEGIQYKSRRTTYRRYIVDCGEYTTNIDTTATVYRAVSEHNETLETQDWVPGGESEITAFRAAQGSVPGNVVIFL